MQDQINEFTSQSTGLVLPDRPRPMTKEEVKFIIRMLTDEIYELGVTVMEGSEVVKWVTESVSQNLSRNVEIPTDLVETAADQADALSDVVYYSYNAAGKTGINLDLVLSVVHQANMNKRDPVTGMFYRNKSGKVIKPAGWSAPDIRGLFRQLMKDSTV